MKGFTAGERRGLILLILLLALLLLGKLWADHADGGNESIKPSEAHVGLQTVIVHSDSIVASDSLGNANPAQSERKEKSRRKSAVKRESTPPRTREPLDETLN